ncbi:MAG: Lrp/AsnC family transcriptional regulator [Clostridia bacterium]|nr:Lrp/AsnC family transcriptional regulator [Clostridia bacterium]
MEEILEILEENNRISPEEIAKMVNMDVEEVKSFIKSMEEQNVIVKYNTIINWEKTEKDLVTALIEVRVTPQRGEGFDAIAERIYRFPQVKSLYLMSGAYDLAVVVEGKTMKEVAYFVAEQLSVLDSVVSTATHFILKKYKDDGVIFEDKEKDRRLVIAP